MYKNILTIDTLEKIGVLMRIACFTLLSFQGKETPFLFLWIINTCDAIILTYCAFKRNNKAYLLLNSFWILVGLIGIYNSLKS